MKLSTSDILSILKLFGVALVTDTTRMIDQTATFHPLPTNTLMSFRFQRRRFYLLIDQDAEDDKEYIKEQVTLVHLETHGELLKNPQKSAPPYALSYKGKDVYLFAVTLTKKRLDLILADRHHDISRSTWQKYIKAGHIRVNDRLIDDPSYEVSRDEVIATTIPKATDFSDRTLPIIYLDDNVIVVNKPAGTLTHSKGALNDEFTVADFFQRYSVYHQDTNRPGIVHRLDRDTSGVIIGARTDASAALLGKQFADRKVKKSYIAIVKGTPKLPHATIDLPIARHPTAPSTFRIDSKGKSAITEYTVIGEGQGYSLIKLQPLTGRTHQLRVHLKYLGIPILGDRVYGKPADRLYLHAQALEITIPVSQRMTFTAPIPSEFLTLFPSVTL